MVDIERLEFNLVSSARFYLMNSAKTRLALPKLELGSDQRQSDTQKAVAAMGPNSLASSRLYCYPVFRGDHVSKPLYAQKPGGGGGGAYISASSSKRKL